MFPLYKFLLFSSFSSLSMESTYRCRADVLEVFDGLRGLPQWNSTGRFCSRRHRGSVLVTSGSLAKIRFKTDSSVRGRGFRVSARAGKSKPYSWEPFI